MIRVMIVEDEPPIASSLKRIIETENDIFEVVNISLNGKRALEYLEKNSVDLVFTDIKMPIMDGLELAKNISENYTKTSVIIVSGFQDFEYAKTALKYKAIDYILKPISKNEIISTLDKYKLKFEEMNKIGQRDLLEKTFTGENVGLKFDDYEQYGVLLCCFGAFPLTFDAIDLNNYSNLTNAEIEKAVSLINRKGSCMCINGKSIAEKIILLRADDINEVICTSNDIFEFLKETSNKQVTIVIHNTLVNMNNMKNIFKALRKELYKRSTLFISKVLVYGQVDIKPKSSENYIDIEMVKALTSKDKNYILKVVGSLLDYTTEIEMTQKDFIMLLEKYAMNFYDKFLDISQLSEIRQQIELSVTTADTKKHLAKELSEVLHFWLTPEIQSTDTNELMEELGNFIRINHKDNISLSKLAKQFGMSSADLSKKFKSYHNMSVPEFVNNYRVSLAIGLMNYDKNKMIKEISIEVGYNDQYYFSKIFKKIVGVWPTEYTTNKDS